MWNLTGAPSARAFADLAYQTLKSWSRKRRVVANFRGSNSAPSWSPDGRTLAVTLSRDGGSQLFVLDANGGEPRRLTQSSGIDTEPVFSPDGTAIYFVSQFST